VSAAWEVPLDLPELYRMVAVAKPWPVIFYAPGIACSVPSSTPLAKQFGTAFSRSPERQAGRTGKTSHSKYRPCLLVDKQRPGDWPVTTFGGDVR